MTAATSAHAINEAVAAAASAAGFLLPDAMDGIPLSADDRRRFEAFLKVHPDELLTASPGASPAFDMAALLGALVVALAVALALLAAVWHVYGADVCAVLDAQGDIALARNDMLRCSASCIALGAREQGSLTGGSLSGGKGSAAG